jgi:hypothetical protein
MPPELKRANRRHPEHERPGALRGAEAPLLHRIKGMAPALLRVRRRWSVSTSFVRRSADTSGAPPGLGSCGGHGLGCLAGWR